MSCFPRSEIPRFLSSWLAPCLLAGGLCLFASPAGAQVPREKSEPAANVLPVLKVSIAPQYLEKLESKRQAAWKAEFLITEPGDFVPAYISVNGGKPVKVSVRLKGDMLEHTMEVFSLRVKVKKGKKIFGMSKFSLHRPAMRLGHFEAILLRHLREAGNLSVRYFHVEYYLNDKYQGPMAVEEHFTKELLESQGRRESVIMAMDESISWAQRALNLEAKKNPELNRGQYTYQSDWLFPYRGFQTGKIWKNPYLRIHYREAVELLRGYRFLNIYSDQVFDMQLLARYLAIVNFWNAHHSLQWTNIRIYYNPITRLFEPIGFDNQVQHFQAEHYNKIFPRYFFQSTSCRFVEAYKKEVLDLKRQIEQEALLEKLSAWESAMLQRLGNPAWKAYPYENARRRITLMSNDLPTCKRDRDKMDIPSIQKTPTVKAKDLGKAYKIATILVANYIETEGRTYLELANITDQDVVVEKVYIKSRSLGANFALPATRIKVPPFNMRKWNLVEIDVPKTDFIKDEIHVLATYDQYNARQDVMARPYFAPAKKAKYQPLEMKSFLKRHPFIRKTSNRELVVTPGLWKVKDHLVIPTGYTLRIGQGTTLRFAAGRRLVLRGPLWAQGEKDEPVKLIASNPYSGWGGIVVLKSEGPSYLSHVVAKDIKQPRDDDWGLTGAITFYESDVTFQNTYLEKNRTEDFVNIIRSKFEMASTTISHTQSDAIDIDFGRGTISGSRFENIGGDAIDISGSQVTARENEIRGVGDKAVSVGERSVFTGEHFKIHDVGMGIVSKDGSFATLSDSELTSVRKIAFAAYIKKPEYESKTGLTITRVKTSVIKRRALAVWPGEIVIDGHRQKPVNYEVEKLYE